MGGSTLGFPLHGVPCKKLLKLGGVGPGMLKALDLRVPSTQCFLGSTSILGAYYLPFLEP